MEDSKPKTTRVTVRRNASRGRYDRSTIDAILDATPFCHLGFIADGAPVTIPTIQARSGDDVYLHGSTGSRLAVRAGGGRPVEVCLSVTLIDGLVVARSAFHHSMNYRSVMLLGDASLVTDPEEKLNALRLTTEHLLPGRWDELRAPTAKELAATSVLRLRIHEASAKVRDGDPDDDERDIDPDVWAGVVPLRRQVGTPEPAANVAPGTSLPQSIRGATALRRSALQ